jgi:hypothetical protein
MKVPLPEINHVNQSTILISWFSLEHSAAFYDSMGSAEWMTFVVVLMCCIIAIRRILKHVVRPGATELFHSRILTSKV